MRSIKWHIISGIFIASFSNLGLSNGVLEWRISLCLTFTSALPLDGSKANEVKDFSRHQEEGGVGAGIVLSQPSGSCLGKAYLAV